ncbi:hypothetical protein [Paludibaculum fermentans]|uniref:Uncharacterized protein n=1 Tax=Paludibaculum fermentans TaxID=1473598 RepID=A0A7S7NQZ1_PALFE|nr:hypothetical protein [Paludibaculum fermentans]QOY88167.1 hypothetical protein IRI77_36435 [Paludibaculum fermentans]
MRNSILRLVLAIAILGGAMLRGQHTTKVLGAVVAKPVATTALPVTIAGTLTMVVNRSRVLGEKVDGSGTRYFSVRDSDLVGKTPAQVAQRLAPAVVTPKENVRTLEIVVDLERPLFVTTTGKAPFAIGTAILDGKLNNLQVNTNITLGEVKITRKE